MRPRAQRLMPARRTSRLVPTPKTRPDDSPTDPDAEAADTGPQAAADAATVREAHESDPHRDYLDNLWWSSKRWVAAAVVAVFPLVFIIDEAVDLAFSPVLPSILALALLVILLPFGVMELRWRRLAKKNAQKRHDTALRGRQSANAAFVVAIVWFLLWLALGA